MSFNEKDLVDLLNSSINKLGENTNEIYRTSPHNNWIRHLESSFSGQYINQDWLICMDLLYMKEVNEHLSRYQKHQIYCHDNLPGSFIFAINHYFKSKDIEYTWLLSSFCPQNSPSQNSLLQISQNRPLNMDTLHLKDRNPKNVLFGKLTINSKGKNLDVWNSCDFTSSKTPKVLSELVLNTYYKVNLFVANGGNYVSNVIRNEELNLKTIVNEFKLGYDILQENGVMIIKLYTAFTPFMKSLMITFRRLFKECEIIKPFTSTPIDSVHYFIGVNFIKSQINIPDDIVSSMEWVNPTKEEQAWLNTRIYNLTISQSSSIEKFPNILPLNPKDYISSQ